MGLKGTQISRSGFHHHEGMAGSGWSGALIPKPHSHRWPGKLRGQGVVRPCQEDRGNPGREASPRSSPHTPGLRGKHRPLCRVPDDRSPPHSRAGCPWALGPLEQRSWTEPCPCSSPLLSGSPRRTGRKGSPRRKGIYIGLNPSLQLSVARRRRGPRTALCLSGVPKSARRVPARVAAGVFVMARVHM